MRGGTSKGVFLHARDVPPAGPDRDAVVLDIMGSPDPMQIDGLGGTYSSTSKVIVIEPSGGADDVQYWFGQVGVDRPIVDWSGNCGNLTTAVGPFVIDQGLVDVRDPMTLVRLRNGNTGVAIEAEVPTPSGEYCGDGNHIIAGVPRPGAAVTTRYLEPSGAVFGKLLPLGKPTCEVSGPCGPVTVSIVDVAHPYVFVDAANLGLTLDSVQPSELNTQPEILRALESLRSACAVLLGRVSHAEDAARDSPTVPRLALVAPPTRSDHDISAVAVSMERIHHAFPMTGALCLAAAVRMRGTVPATVADEVAGQTVRIRHPKGVVEALADVHDAEVNSVRSVGVVRTARRLMSGVAYLHGC